MLLILRVQYVVLRSVYTATHYPPARCKQGLHFLWIHRGRTTRPSYVPMGVHEYVLAFSLPTHRRATSDDMPVCIQVGVIQSSRIMFCIYLYFRHPLRHINEVVVKLAERAALGQERFIKGYLFAGGRCQLELQQRLPFVFFLW